MLGTGYVVGLSPDGTHLLGGFTVPAAGAGQGIAIGPQGNVAVLGISGSVLTVSAGQEPGIAGVAGSGSFQVSGQVAPYELISLYGYGIGAPSPFTGVATNGVLGKSLGGTQVLFDGIAAPLLYVGPNQINAIVPGEVAGRATTLVEIVQSFGFIGSTTQSMPLFVVSSQPQIFATPAIPLSVPPVNLAIALNQDGSLNSQANPASAGSVITVWATGSGVPNVSEVDGSIAGTTSLHPSAAPVSLLSNALNGNGFPLDSLYVAYAGDAPDLVAGVIQVNFQLPGQVKPVQTSGGKTALVEIQLQVGDTIGGICGIYVRQ